MNLKLLCSCIAVLAAAALASCGANNKEVSAERLLSTARELEQTNPQAALLSLDSIHEIFPRDIPSRRQADTIEWRIELRQAHKALPGLDSMLRADSVRLADYTGNFAYRKDDNYQDIGLWEHKVFRTENNTHKCYLKPTVNDRGEVVLISFYVGRQCQHNGLTVTVDGYEKSVSNIEDVTSFNDGGQFHEFMSLNDDLNNGLTAFIAGANEESAVVALHGDDETTYKLTKRDIEAFRECHSLAVLLSEMNQFSMQITKFDRQINMLTRRIGEAE